MTERPILFSAPMVRAILAGQKAQTRRVMTKQPHDDTTVHVERFHQTVVDRHGDEQPGPETFGAWWDDGETGLKCPFGAPGNRLWVRESHWFFQDEHDPVTGYTPPVLTTEDVEYRADGESTRHGWRPSIHMPRWASRITLEITEVRVERLQAISEADAKAEGAPGYEEGVDPPPPEDGCKWSYRSSFMRLWESINGAESWAANPWVWVITFKRLEANHA
jgi:hypothetical protein